MIEYGTDYTCTHGEPPDDCPHCAAGVAGPVRDPIPGEPITELGYARRLAHLYGDRLRYVPAWRRWLVWDGRRWVHDETGQAARWMKSIARTMTTEALSERDGDERRRRVGLTRRGESSAGVAGALTLASTEAGIAVATDRLDADPFLLNCANGTYDLRTGELRDHQPADLLTKVTRAAYMPEAAGPTWAKFLERVQPAPEMRAFLARLTGHALEGRVVEHVLPIHHGAGANGKSTFIDAVMYALGDYAATADPELLMARSFDAHPTGVADLFGLRLAVLSEGDAGRRLAEGTVKRLTSTEPVKARRMREDFWSFTPSHTFALLTNHRPGVAGTDEGIWRRLRLVPWDVVIPKEERDPELGEHLRLEADAVLAWLVAGYGEWTERGLDDPEAVTAATAAYRSDSDAVARFLGERCLTGPNHHVRASDLFAAWQRWCALDGDEPGLALTSRKFTAALQERGYDTRHTNTGAVWAGIGLLSEDE